jgi:hypothetical protein
MKKVLDNYNPYVVLASQKKASKTYYQTDKGKDSLRKSHLKRQYNLTLDEYNNKLKEQSHKCAICGTDEVDVKGKLHVDHDHITGKVRELLCINCNTGLGQFKDSIKLLSKAIGYLEKHYTTN